MCDVRKDSYRDICWDPSSGLSPEVLEQEVAELEKQLAGRSKSYVKAKTFELLLEKGQISVTREDIFQEKLNARHIMTAQRNRWWEEAKANFRRWNGPSEPKPFAPTRTSVTLPPTRKCWWSWAIAA